MLDVRMVEINKLDPLMGDDLRMFFHAFENWRHEYSTYDNGDGIMDGPLRVQGRLYESCLGLVNARGGFEQAHLDMQDLDVIREHYALTPNVAQLMVRVEALMHGVLLLKQKKFPEFLAEMRRQITPGAEIGIADTAFNFLTQVEMFNRRLHETKLDQLERVRIDTMRANFFLCVQAKYRGEPDSVLREGFWTELEQIASFHRRSFEQAARYTPRHFTEYSPPVTRNNPKLQIN